MTRSLSPNSRLSASPPRGEPAPVAGSGESGALGGGNAPVGSGREGKWRAGAAAGGNGFS